MSSNNSEAVFNTRIKSNDDIENEKKSAEKEKTITMIMVTALLALAAYGFLDMLLRSPEEKASLTDIFIFSSGITLLFILTALLCSSNDAKLAALKLFSDEEKLKELQTKWLSCAESAKELGELYKIRTKFTVYDVSHIESVWRHYAEDKEIKDLEQERILQFKDWENHSHKDQHND